MCGRFALKESPQKLAEHFQATSELEFSPSFNIAPSSSIITITADQDEQRHLHQMRWGLIPSWAKDPSIGNKLVNARGDTVHEKPSFRSAFKYRRCIIPASGFYEWKTESGKKNPWYISLKSGEPMAMAGLWETWQPEGGEAIQTCCIITTEANELMLPIHDRMPVILDGEQWGLWLSHHETKSDRLLPMIHPHSSETMQSWAVSRELNRVGVRNDAGLVEPLTNQSLFD